MTRLIGVTGRAGAGKDTIAQILKYNLDCDVGNWTSIAFASPLKEICQQVFEFSHDQLYGSLETKNAPDKRYPRPDGTFLTSREAMQVLGTEFGRRCYPDIWIEMGMRKAKRELAAGRNVVITDVRFVNEAMAIRAYAGEIWRVYRPSADAVPATHTSETELDSVRMAVVLDREIHNTGTIDDLRDRVRECVKAMNLEIVHSTPR